MSKVKTYQNLGPFSDLIAFVKMQHSLFPPADPGKLTQEAVRKCLAFNPKSENPQDVCIDKKWQKDGLVGEQISWTVGYGPRTQAWLLYPEGKGPFPSVVALHDHGGFKYYGKEKIAEGPDGLLESLNDFRKQYYGGRAFANALAQEGFAVIVPDTFLWGSRKMPFENLPEYERGLGRIVSDAWNLPTEIWKYNIATGFNEHTIAKYCNILGISLPGIISYEDRVAVEYLAHRKDICNGKIGCVGLSGGGLRSTLLQATCDRIRAAVVVGLMSTYEGLLDHNVGCHTWMLYPPFWSIYGDWTDLAGCRAPSPMLVQYDLEDALFTVDGMKDADKKLKLIYKKVNAEENYCGEFHPGPHKFDLEMQKSAFLWLKRMLAS